MFADEYAATAAAAKTKDELERRNPLGFFVSSLLAGLYVGIGIMSVFTIGGMLSGLPYARIVMAMFFGVALSMVMMAGSELFTGNSLAIMAGTLHKTISPGRAAKLLLICYVGNWLGAALLGVMYFGSGIAVGQVGEFIAAAAAGKMSLPVVPMLLRAVLCNALVCIAVWCSFRLKSESGKLIMVFWCMFTFLVTGYEHSVANMSVLTVAMLAPFGAAVSWGGYFYNILLVSLGNVLGGIICVALPYYVISKENK